MTTEEKIDEIHDAVLTLKLNQESFKDACIQRHKALSEDISSHDKALYGNGSPGLIVKFDRLETRLIAWSTAAIIVVQFIAPRIAKAIGW